MNIKNIIAKRTYWLRLDIKNYFVKKKREAWNKGILLWWYRLFIRKDECHLSLSCDPDAMLGMNSQELNEYLLDIGRRRKIACQRDIERQLK